MLSTLTASTNILFNIHTRQSMDIVYRSDGAISVMEQSGVYQIQTRRNADRSCSGNISIRVLGKGLQILVETAKCASIDEAYANLAIEIANSEYDCDWTPPSPFGY